MHKPQLNRQPRSSTIVLAEAVTWLASSNTVCFAQSRPATAPTTQPATRRHLTREEREREAMNRTWQDAAAYLNLSGGEIEQLGRDKPATSD